jgi:imidazolonepropionase
LQNRDFNQINIYLAAKKMPLFIKNIKQLVSVYQNPPEKLCGKEMSSIPILDDAYLFMDDEKIFGMGKMEDVEAIQEIEIIPGLEVIDASGRMVFPSWCDSHTHLVYAGSREDEFVDKIKGLDYEEIARRGGGIISSVKKLRAAGEEDLIAQAMSRVHEIILGGTGAVEIKSGYGLSLESEMKMLRVIDHLKKSVQLSIRSTFLAAHAVPPEYKENRAGYVNLIIEEMLPLLASSKLADYCDVFCDRGFFTVEETDLILKAGLKYGLIPKIHANELDRSGGIQVGVKNGALSVDHLEYTSEEEVKVLLNSSTMPTLLPTTAFFLRLPYAPARKMIDAGLPVALASDYNPGSSPSGKMSFVLSLACIQMRMTPEEAINAATINGAYAMGLSATHGTITPGKKANVFISKPIPSLSYLPYAFGSDLVETSILNGKIYHKT